jgi:hypothetical protein
VWVELPIRPSPPGSSSSRWSIGGGWRPGVIAERLTLGGQAVRTGRADRPNGAFVDELPRWVRIALGRTLVQEPVFDGVLRELGTSALTGLVPDPVEMRSDSRH